MRPAAHVLELRLVPGDDVGAVIDELHAGGCHQEIVRVDVATNYPRLPRLSEQGQQFRQVPSLVLRSLFKGINCYHAIPLFPDLQQIWQRPVAGNQAHQQFQELDPLRPVPRLPVMEVLVDQPSVSECDPLFSNTETGQRPRGEFSQNVLLRRPPQRLEGQSRSCPVPFNDLRQLPQEVLNTPDIDVGNSPL